MFLVILLGVASVILVAISSLELATTHAIDFSRPGNLLSLLDSPALFYWSVSTTLMVGLGLGMLSAVVFHLHLARKIDDQIERSRAELEPRRPSADVRM